MTLRPDSQGPAVLALQQALNTHGASLTLDGHYGPRTEAAVAFFQVHHVPLRVDGVAGPATLTALGLASEPGTFPIPPPGYILGVDTSAAQGLLDVPSLQAAGASFLFAKATDGEHSVDPQWPSTALACAHHRMPFGAYGVLEPYGPSRAALQALHFIERVQGAGATLPPVCDFELAHGLSGLAALEAAVVWCDVVEQALGRAVMVYTGPAFVETLERYAGRAGSEAVRALGERPLFLAHYTGDWSRAPRVPPPWTSRALWQTSGDYRVSRNAGTLPPPGHGAVDVDLFEGDIAALAALGVG